MFVWLRIAPQDQLTSICNSISVDACVSIIWFAKIANDGDGIPIEMHIEHKVYAPELIFGHLLTSGNYDKTEEKIVGGKNGYVWKNLKKLVLADCGIVALAGMFRGVFVKAKQFRFFSAQAEPSMSRSQMMLVTIGASAIGIAAGGYGVYRHYNSLNSQIYSKMQSVEAPGAVYRVGFTGLPGAERSAMIACAAAQLRSDGFTVLIAPRVEELISVATNRIPHPNYLSLEEPVRHEIYQGAMFLLQNAIELSFQQLPVPSQDPTIVMYDGIVSDVAGTMPLETLSQVVVYNRFNMEFVGGRYDLIVRFGPPTASPPETKELERAEDPIARSKRTVI